MNKTIYDFYGLFGIQVGLHYHAFDYAVQVCNKSFKLYEETKDELKELCWETAQKVAKTMNPPIPIERYNPRFK